MNYKEQAAQTGLPLWLVRFVPLCYFGGGGSSGSFRRSGTGKHARYFSIPADINDKVSDAVSGAQTDPGLATKQVSLFNNLMDNAMSAESQPGYSEIKGFSTMSPLDYSGRDALLAASSRDPYSGAYAQETLGRYQQDAADAMSQVASGPSAVRGGDARTGVMQGQLAERLSAGRGQELRQAQLQDLGGVITAARSMGDIEGGRLSNSLQAALGLSGIANSVGERGLEAGKAVDVNKLQNLSLLQLATTLQGKTLDKQVDNFSGEGDQSGWQGGVSCCFIFLEALNGELPWYVELARKDLWTPARRAGYTWMSKWLVPTMRASAVVKHLVNAVVVKPFLAYGAWLYGENDGYGWALAPYCSTWLRVWGWLGR